ncbi:MAG: SHOCT domain-containing protein [Gammaproteobacteria bacterium]|nr:SHOCT domain-containing protein [Gammaproteobacteria bacterium]
MKKILIVSIIFLISCASSDVKQLSDDTYVLSREDHGDFFSGSDSLSKAVISDANAFAEKQGKVAVEVSSHATAKGEGTSKWASFEYKFLVVDENDPLAKKAVLGENKNDTIEQPKDSYTELLQLDDLRKKGILTEDEFQTEKAKILSRD